VEKGKWLADHGEVEVIFAGAVDRDFVAGIGMSHDAGGWIVEEYPFDSRVGFSCSIAADHDTGMLRVAHADTAPMMKADPSRSAGRIKQRIQQRPVADRIRAVEHRFGFTVGAGDAARV